MGIALIMLMAGFIKICSVHTPSSNPKLPPPKPLPGKVLSNGCCCEQRRSFQAGRMQHPQALVTEFMELCSGQIA